MLNWVAGALYEQHTAAGSNDCYESDGAAGTVCWRGGLSLFAAASAGAAALTVLLMCRQARARAQRGNPSPSAAGVQSDAMETVA